MKSHSLIDTLGNDLEQETLAAIGIEAPFKLFPDSMFQVPKLSRWSCDDAFMLWVGDGFRKVVNLYQLHLVGA